ncbi:MAG: FAD-dependent monooxygenase [Methylovirgula sp.]|jgi:salicylate hydroxylase
MSKTPHALIAGAGIGGLSAALALQRAGFRVSLFERAKILEEVGAGLQISPNASAILRDFDLLPRLAGLALEPEALRIKRARDGATLQLLPLAKAKQRWGAPYLLIHRGDLHQALLERVAQEEAITLALDTDIAGFASGHEDIEIVARRGLLRASYRGDCLVGADGLRSFVRERMVTFLPGTPRPAPLPAKARYTAWRTLIAAEDLPAAFLKPESVLWLGPGAHLVHYPLRGGSVINVVAVLDDSVAIDWLADLWSAKGDQQEIASRFASWHREARTLIGAAPEWCKWPLVDLDPLPQWSAGRVALLGDAAHPMLPFLAQGAAQAIEDAAMLGAMLSPEKPIEPSLAAYAAARRPRANRVQLSSRRQGRIYHLAGPLAYFRDLALQKENPQRFLARYDWLYRTRPVIK